MCCLLAYGHPAITFRFVVFRGVVRKTFAYKNSFCRNTTITPPQQVTGTPLEHTRDTKMKKRIKGKWNIHCRSRCPRRKIGLVSLWVLRPVVFVPHGAKEHHGMFPTGPTTPPFSISNHHTVTLNPYQWKVSHRPHYPPPSQSLTTTPAPCTPTPRLLSLLAVVAPPPPLTYAHTKTMIKAPPHTHPPPHLSLLPPSSILPFP